MPEATVVDTATDSSTVVTTPTAVASTDATPSLGWRAGLPDDLKQNTDLATYKTVGDFTKEALTWKSKVSDLESKLGDAIPKLPDNATDEDRATYYDALGRPEKASEYEFEGEDKNAPEWTSYWKDEFHQLGLTKAQAKSLSAKFNGQIQKMVDAYNTARKAEMTSAEQKLRSELGDKYDTSVELAKRLWQQHGEGEFDQAFAAETSPNRFGIIKLLLKMAALTGEDTSPQAGHSRSTGEVKPEDAWMRMYANPVGGKR